MTVRGALIIVCFLVLLYGGLTMLVPRKAEAATKA